MKYSIQPPDNVVEASYSSDPDDVSVASIRVVAERPAGESLSDLTLIRFTVSEGLTDTPTSITPVAGSFDDWEMQPEGGRVFVATPKSPAQGGADAQKWIFSLHDLEVAPIRDATTPDQAFIRVEEVRADSKDAPPQELLLRKINPSLRIDAFRVIAADDTPLDGTTDSNTPVSLAWATTAAKTVKLFGPAIDGDEVSADGSLDVKPTTTSVYTLVASNASSHAVAQVTVTVTDQTAVAKLVPVDGDWALAPYVMSQAHWVQREEGAEGAPLLTLARGTNRDKVCLFSMHFDDEPHLAIEYVGRRAATKVILNNGGGWDSPSDAALKEDVADLPATLERVRTLRPVTFCWKGRTETNVGFVAQEVDEVFPHLVGVTTGSEGEEQRTLAYAGFGVLAIAAIKELAATSEARIDALEQQVAELTRRLERLERQTSEHP